MLYYFQLGSHENLSVAEIMAVLISLSISTRIISNKSSFLVLESADTLNTPEIMEKLGGTVAIGEEVPRVGTALSTLRSYLANIVSEGKIEFSLHGANAKHLALLLKKELKQAGRSVRYIEPKNTATILHNRLVEKQTDLVILGENLFVTRAVQPIEELSSRDYDRPGRDSRSGMLPPKLARMMVNLGSTLYTTGRDLSLLDPFCGSGTVLTEAILLGYTHIYGTDISEKAIADTQKNITWTLENFYPEMNQNLSPLNLFCLDVKNLAQKIKKSSIDIIVTEPYLGQPLRGGESKKFLENQTQELGDLYKAAFRSFQTVLKPGGTVIFIIPEFQFQNSWITIPCLPEIQKLGFKIVPLDGAVPSLLYHRPNQFVARRIWKFVHE